MAAQGTARTATLVAVLASALAAPCTSAQPASSAPSASPAPAVQVSGSFRTATVDAGWQLGGSAALTAPAIDADGDGWLRLTGASFTARGQALSANPVFSAAQGLTLSLRHAAWGGGVPGADGISVFLFDAAQDMAGATPGGGLGYCKGAGGWLALGLDEFGNFSHPADGCAGGGGPGPRPQSIAVRGPVAAGNPFVAGTAAPGQVDRPQAGSRPAAAEVQLDLRPRPGGAGFVLSVDWRAPGAEGWTRLLDKVDFPYAAPASLRVGAAASTGLARNIHEIRDLSVRTHLPALAALSFSPAVVAPGAVSQLSLRLAGGGGRSASLRDPLTLNLPEGLAVASAPAFAGTCPGAVRASPGGTTLTLERGATLRAAGCTVSVNVTAARAGRFRAELLPGSLVTDTGSNRESASSVLDVQAGPR